LKSDAFVGSDLSVMADVFYSPRLTLVRANYHIQNFKALVHSFADGQPWTYIVDRQSQPGKIIHKIKFTQPLPEMLPCILFDAVNNLRAVLDQSGYAAATAAGRANPKKTNFPFGDDPAQLENNIVGRKVCEHLPPEIVSLFRGFEPYERGKGTSLWVLNKLCNSKKHSSLVPLKIGNAIAVFQGDVSGEDWTTSADDTGIGWNDAEREMTMMIAKAGTNANIRGNLSFQIAIEGVDAVRGQAASAALNNMRDVVERVLSATEAECRRLALKID
jgi:hypothetical protein